MWGSPYCHTWVEGRVSLPSQADWISHLRQAWLYLRTFGKRLKLSEFTAPTFS